jgi:hypothetical protein
MASDRGAMEAAFRLKKPCANCPFLKCGAIDLAPGRLDSIIAQLVGDDHSTFQCHKTVHHKVTGGQWDEEGHYHSSGKESMCAGAIIYLEKMGRPTVGMRLGRVFGVYDPKVLAPHHDLVLDPSAPLACQEQQT